MSAPLLTDPASSGWQLKTNGTNLTLHSTEGEGRFGGTLIRPNGNEYKLLTDPSSSFSSQTIENGVKYCATALRSDVEHNRVDYGINLTSKWN